MEQTLAWSWHISWNDRAHVSYMILDIIANKELKHQLSVQIKSGKKLSKDYVHGRGLNGQFFVQISD